MVDRLTAFKIRISDLLAGALVKESGEFGIVYVAVDGLKVGRVNLIASVVSIDGGENFSEFVLDDGSGIISARSFESIITDVKVGDLVNIIGKVREFSGSKYVVCEMLSKISDIAWLEFRKIEIDKLRKVLDMKKDSVPSVVESVDAIEEVVDAKEEAVDSSEKKNEEAVVNVPVKVSPVERVLNLIREQDKGDGVDVDNIISLSGFSDCERLIDSLLAEGDIFEVRPGRIKVLE